MRSATFAATFLAALLAAPGLARAQGTAGPGQVTFDNAFIGAEGCSSTATSPPTVRMAWSDQLDSASGGVATAGVFRIYASNTLPALTASGARFCATQNDPNASPPVFAGLVGSDRPNSGTQLTGVAEAVNESALVGQAGYGACTQDGKPVYVCVHFYPYQTGTTVPSATATAWAFGTMTLSLTKPSVVTLDQLLPGNGALNVYWSDHASPQAAKYKVRALSLDPTMLTSLPSPGDFDPASAYSAFDPRDPNRHETGFLTGTKYRMSGLLNDVPYAVAVIAYSAAESPSEPSNILSSEPQLVNDFWQLYQAAGGKETGGCSAGFAGPVGLGLLLATLALVRRRK
jgi:hypothetical protein